MSSREEYEAAKRQGWTPQEQSIVESYNRRQATHTGEGQKYGFEGARHAAQGLTLGFGDEIEAWARSTFGEEEYQPVVNEIRAAIAESEQMYPGWASSAEVGGSMAPAIVGLLASAFTGGTSASAATPLIRQIIKGAAAGGGFGGLYEMGKSTGSPMERLTDPSVALGAGLGAVGGGVGTGALVGGARGMQALFSGAKDLIGESAEKQARKFLIEEAEKAGISADEMADMVLSGRVLADNETLARLAAGARKRGGTGADQVFRDVYSGPNARPDRLTSETIDYLQRTTGSETGALKKQLDKMKADKERVGAEYDAFFGQDRPAGPTVQASLEQSLLRDPSVGAEAKKLYKMRTGDDPFFEIEDGVVMFNRDPTVEEGEIVRRALDDAASAEYRAGRGALGESYRGMEEGVRDVLDREHPELPVIRQKWEGIKSQEEAFAEGQKAISRGGEQAALDIAALEEKGDMAALEAYRRGLMTRFNRMAETGQRAGMMGRISDPNKAENQILDMLLGDDEFAEVTRMAQNAADAQRAKQTILGGSQTAFTQGDAARQGGILPFVAEMGGEAMAFGGMPIMSISKKVNQTMRELNPRLTEEGAVKLAELLVETDPVTFQKAMAGDGAALRALKGLADRISGMSVSPAAIGFGVGGQAGAADF